MATLVFYKKNSQFIKVSGLKDQSTTPATFINDATLTATLYDSAGTAITGATDMTGDYQSGSDGEYRFIIDPLTFDPPKAGGYKLFIEGDSGGKKFHAELPAKVSIRQTGTES